MKYIILYGSESKLIKDLYIQDEEHIIIKIHGSHSPIKTKQENYIDGNSELMYEEVLNAVSNAVKGDQIIFIGAAFKADNSLLVTSSEEEIEKLLKINVMSYVKLIKKLIPIMVKIRSGNFIYLSSFRATNTTKGAVIYSASKAFGESFFVGIAREYGRYGVKANSIRMGYFDGRILSSLGGEEEINKVKNRSPLKRLGNAEDLKKAILYCVESPYTTGGVLEINGALDLQ